MKDTDVAAYAIFAHEFEKLGLPTLADQKFFEPLPKFGGYMATQFDGELIYDVGAGRGHVAADLARRGLRVDAIDIMRRETYEFPVLMVDGAACGYRKGSVVMLCRPCHGWFPEAVIEQAIRCKAGAIIYVGLPKSKKMDLGRHVRKFKREMAKVGKDGESIYVWRLERRPRTT